MIRVHHLEQSRSQRILWLLEELGLEYEVVHYARDPETRRAPPALRTVHPLGKSPMIEDGDLLLPESGAIADYLVRRYGAGRLSPPEDGPDFGRYLQWLHFAEGSAMFPLLLDMFLGMAGDGGAALAQHVGAELRAMLGHLDDELATRPHFAGEAFSAADVLMTFVLEFASTRVELGDFPHLAEYVGRMHARPAYHRALERGAGS